MDWWVESEGSNTAELHTQESRFESSVKLFFSLLFGSRSSWLYNIPDAYENSRGHTSSLPPTKCMWSRFLLPPWTPASCLLQVPGTFSAIFVQPRSDLRHSIDRRQRGLQVNIQHINSSRLFHWLFKQLRRGKFFLEKYQNPPLYTPQKGVFKR